MAKLFKSKYFSAGDFIQARPGNNCSFVWRSLLWGRELFVKGIRCRVGNGRNIQVFNDPWLLRPHSFKPITIHIKCTSR